MFEYYNPNPYGKRVGDCSVRAVSKALGLTWQEAYAQIVVEGYAQGDVPSSNAVWGEVLRNNGFVRAVDGVKQNYENRIAGLQNALDASRSDNQALRFAASQGAQTSAILASNEAQTNALEQYLAPVPRPAYVVQNPNCCSNNLGWTA